MGTLAERMRAAGAGIPAFFTRTGMLLLLRHTATTILLYYTVIPAFFTRTGTGTAGVY